MKYLFDANAIFLGYKRGLESILADGYTINLAIFEIGNVIWKETFIYRSISLNEAIEILDALSDLLDLMTIIHIDVLEKEILRIALMLGITYYDASYVYSALKKNLVFVTEDKKLMRAIKNKIKLSVTSLTTVSR